MPQTSIYLDDATSLFVRSQANKRGVSLSKLVSQILNDYATSPKDAWPVGYWEDIYGCASDNDFPGTGNASSDDCLDSNLDDTCDWWVR